MPKIPVKKKAKPKTKYKVNYERNPEALTEKQKRFILEYCVVGQGALAARNAGYAYKSSSFTANQLLKNPYIAAEIAKRQIVAAEKAEVKSVEVLRQLYFILTRDALDFCDPATGAIITDIRLLSPRARASINGIEQEVVIMYDRNGDKVGEKIKTKLKLVPKEVAIDMAMKHKGLFKPSDGKDEKFDVDWDAIAEDNRTNQVDLIVSDPLKYLTARTVEAVVVSPGNESENTDNVN